MKSIDKQTREIQAHCKANCRKICELPLAYSLPGKYWHERHQSIRALIRRLDGKTKNDGNICRKARKRVIKHPRHLTRSDLLVLKREAIKARKKVLKSQQAFLRREHVCECLNKAKAKNDLLAIKKIKEIQVRESTGQMWKGIHRVTRDSRSPSLMRVERMENDVLVSYTNEEDILRVIMEETESRFSLADEAPISNHSISKELGDFGETEAAQQLQGGFPSCSS
jgi:hypothetical protein